jgi:hypothetical protein
MGLELCCLDGAIIMTPLWGYNNGAPMGLELCCLDGAIIMTPLWGWNYVALMVL